MASAKLSDDQIALIRQWADAGADLNEIQDRLKTEAGVTLTFMETRFLLSDLGITLREAREGEENQTSEETADAEDAVLNAENDLPGGGVKLTVDEITLPGCIASGRVTFSDGKTASWYLDQLGRLGLTDIERTYQPSEEDAMAFQRELQKALRQAGY